MLLDPQEIYARYGGHGGAQRRIQELESDEDLVRAIFQYVLDSENRFVGASFDHILAGVCFDNPACVTALGARVDVVLRKIRALELFEEPRRNGLSSPGYVVLSRKGRDCLRRNSHFDLILGPLYTVVKSAKGIVIISGSLGSGTAIHIGQGRYLTCAHCVTDGPLHIHDTERGTSHVVESVTFKDLAIDIGQVQCGHAPDSSIEFAESDPERLSKVLVLHYPNIPSIDRVLLSTSGEINGIGLNYLQKQNVLLISAKTAPGSSGGAVIDEAGKLVGIVSGFGQSIQSTASFEAVDSAFYQAVPISSFRHLLS